VCAQAQSTIGLKMPDNIRQVVEYDDSANVYYIGSKIGDTYLNVSQLMTPKEYQQWVEQKALREFFRQKNTTNIENGG
jgi:cell surface protein SprA